MLYFIKSEYWSKHYKCDTWWKPESNGYTSLLPLAGIYTEEDKTKMEKYHTEDRCLFVPITQEIWEKAYKQLEMRGRVLRKRRLSLAQRYEADMKEIQEEEDKNENLFAEMEKLAKALGH